MRKARKMSRAIGNAGRSWPLSRRYQTMGPRRRSAAVQFTGSSLCEEQPTLKSMSCGTTASPLRGERIARVARLRSTCIIPKHVAQVTAIDLFI
jgi:hypothetical protein